MKLKDKLFSIYVPIRSLYGPFDLHGYKQNAIVCNCCDQIMVYGKIKQLIFRIPKYSD